ncbi:hypothetical protein JTB14_001677 [Gonioctena quinquepunctata]|nr:hypothetical protein JTB14_001677 [Gonioctena quinquepunctata]
MDSVGAEVGQKMRSAIKAKLLELNCYVDDELPDYIMVMVANKRTKSQMNEDLSLFLNTKTSTFVEWLHIVLKKLKEVTVTNPEVYKKVTKRKSGDQPDVKVKKEKKCSKKLAENIKKEEDLKKSLTDNLPMNANRLSEQRKITIVGENKNVDTAEDEFDIPLLSEVSASSEKDLEDIERKIRNVKSRLGLIVDDDLEMEIHNIKSEREKVIENVSQSGNVEGHRIVEMQIEPNEFETSNDVSNQISTVAQEHEEGTSFTPEKIRRHTPITFDDEESIPRKTSVLDRLGEKPVNDNELNSKKQRKRSRNDRDRHARERSVSGRRYSPEGNRSGLRKTENKSILSRLGVMSKIHIPQKESEELDSEDELKMRKVRSMVQVKPRVMPSDAQQPNKNLLLKAVAEAHRSVAQSTRRESRQAVKRTFEETEDNDDDVPITRKLSHSEKVKLRNMILAQVSQENSDTDGEDKEVYIPKPLKKVPRDALKYVPSSRTSVEEQSDPEKKTPPLRPSIKSRLDGKKSPSPIIFNKLSTKILNKPNVPDRLPVVHPPLSIKNKERCKYWPGCRQGDKCEFIHPTSICEMFPNCKFGEKCMYLHPKCKFGSGCTKRDCPYSHTESTASVSKLPVTQPQICKFFPKLYEYHMSVLPSEDV